MTTDHSRTQNKRTPGGAGSHAAGETWPWYVGYLVVAGAITIALGRVSGHELLYWDDRVNITANPHFAPPGLGRLGYFWREPYALLYIPATYTFWGLEAVLAFRPEAAAPHERFDPRVFHAGNLLLHIAASWLVLGVLVRLVRHRGAACAGALLYGLHPLAVESVAWVTETKGLLSALFGWAAVWLYLSATEPDRRGLPLDGAGGRPEPPGAPRPNLRLGGRGPIPWLLYAAATGCLVLALLSKPSAVALPWMVLAIDLVWRRSEWLGAAGRLAPWFALALATWWLTKSLQPDEVIPTATPLWQRPLVAGHAVAWYLRKLLVPIALGVDYGKTPEATLGDAWGYVACLAPLALAVLLALAPDRRAWLTALAVFIAALLPVSGLAAFRFQEYSTVADRYAYLALVGPALAAAYWLAGHWRPGWIALAAAVLAILGVESHLQAANWRNDQVLFEHALEVNPTSHLAYTQLGSVHERAGRGDDALAAYRRALEINPLAVVARNNLANLLARSGQIAAAAVELERVVELDPQTAEWRINLALVLAQAGQLEAALAQLDAARQLEPGSAAVLINRAAILARADRLTEAEAALRTLLKEHPQERNARLNLGVVLAQQGQAAAARAEYEQAAAEAPLDAVDHLNLGLALLAAQRPADAVAALEQAAAVDPRWLAARLQLGRALIAAGRRQEGLDRMRAVLAEAPQAPAALCALALALAESPANPAQRRESLQLARQGCELSGYSEPNCLEALAAAQAAAGQFDEALKTTELALAAARRSGRSDMFKRLEERRAAIAAQHESPEP